MKFSKNRLRQKWEELFSRILKRLFVSNYSLQRFFLYKSPKGYWEDRGGEKYFAEQEIRNDREERSVFIANEVAALKPGSVCEVGCGYGKQLKNLRKLNTSMKMVGIDFSEAQLKKAKEFADRDIALICADAGYLPFADNSFDLVLTSAVIMHNPPEDAELIRSEIKRIACRYIVHNEDTNVDLTRYGYNTSEIYKKMGLKVIKSCEIPVAPDPSITQFVIVKLTNHE